MLGCRPPSSLECSRLTHHGFKRFTTAWRTLRGIEIMHALRKGQARWIAKGNVVGQVQLIQHVFGVAA